MRALIAAAALSLTAGCAVPAGCFVGFALVPPSPVVICGIDVEPKGKED